ncbi:MAG TPA: hypothetical protein VK762_33440 [Polyangiaceae bacterium]|nr:hypothetical protein [Polyangiaceae bacterium]
MKALSACFAIGVVFLGCSSSSGSDAAGGTCGKVAACGGDIVGTWNIVTACASASSSSTSNTMCPNESLQSTSLTASGTATFNADMTYSVDVTESLSETVIVPTSCLTVGTTTITCDELSTAFGGALATDAGAPMATCTSSGGNCDCTISLSGLSTHETGTYTLSNNSVVTTPMGGTASSGDYCVQGNTLHLVSSAMDMGGGMPAVSTDIVATK